MKLAMPKIFQRKPHFERKSARYRCQIEAQLTLIDRGLNFDGRIIDLSAGGAMFRPPLAHIMYRRDLAICLVVGDEPIMGTIVSTTPAGFGLRFDELLSDQELVALMEHDAARVKASPQPLLS